MPQLMQQLQQQPLLVQLQQPLLVVLQQPLLVAQQLVCATLNSLMFLNCSRIWFIRWRQRLPRLVLLLGKER
jgi:hypothetical protein